MVWRISGWAYTRVVKIVTERGGLIRTWVYSGVYDIPICDTLISYIGFYDLFISYILEFIIFSIN